MPYRYGRGTAGLPFHVLNRGARKLTIFESDADYRAFLLCLSQSLARYPLRLFAYCLMPNHVHLVAMPLQDGQLSAFMKHLLGTHAHRWRRYRKSAGEGAVYQGRFRAFPIQADAHFYAVCRYVERNALRAGLVERAEDWPWSSLCGLGGFGQMVELAEWPVPKPQDWLARVNELPPTAEVLAVRAAGQRERPFGAEPWAIGTAWTSFWGWVAIYPWKTRTRCCPLTSSCARA